MPSTPTITIRPATKDLWAAFEALMGPKGGVGGCWCMLWRQNRKDQTRFTGAGNRARIRAAFDAETPPGLLAFDGADPVAWLSIAPRRAFVRLETSRILKPVDDRPVWSISCFLIRNTHRRQGLAIALLEQAKSFVEEQGGSILEGYPVDPKKDPYPGTYAWTGIAESFRRAGFEEVARRSETRPIMRFEISNSAP
ncbi:MAG: GNAT family N-acetyltransferase [Pseudomonadota bacterium]